MNNTSNMESLTRKRVIRSISESTEASSNCTLLMQLRSDGYWRFAKNQATMTMLITYQSEFPRKIREKIAKVAIQETDPKSFCQRIERAWFRLAFCEPRSDTPWRGLDFEIDTQAEIEVAFRTFPHTLRTTLLRSLSTSLKSLPFVPFVAKLAVELLPFRMKDALVESVLNYTNEEYEDQLDEVTLSVMKLFREKKYIEMCQIYKYGLFLLRHKPSRVRKTLLYLINSDPEILLKGHRLNAPPRPIVVIYVAIDEDVSFEHIHMLFELGMIHYPENMGFFFERLFSIFRYSAYREASKNFGKERVNKMVQEVLSRTIGGDSKAIMSSIVAMQKRSNVEELDALYLLCRLNPDIFLPLFQSKT